MSRLVRVARAEDLPPGTGAHVVVEGHAVAVFNVDGSFHAIDGVCLHRGGPVGEGDLDGTVVTCPWHGWQYDVTTGRHVLDPSVGLPRFDVVEREGEILVALPRE